MRSHHHRRLTWVIVIHHQVRQRNQISFRIVTRLRARKHSRVIALGAHRAGSLTLPVSDTTKTRTSAISEFHDELVAARNRVRPNWRLHNDIPSISTEIGFDSFLKNFVSLVDCRKPSKPIANIASAWRWSHPATTP